MDGLGESLLSKAVDSGDVEMFELVSSLTRGMSVERTRGKVRDRAAQAALPHIWYAQLA